MGNICLPVPMQWVTKIEHVRCERKNHNILTLRTLREVTYRNWYLDFCDEACGFYIRPTFHWCVIGTLSQIYAIVIVLGKWIFQRHAKKLKRFHLNHVNCMRKLLKIKWKDKIITFIYIIPLLQCCKPQQIHFSFAVHVSWTLKRMMWRHVYCEHQI